MLYNIMRVFLWYEQAIAIYRTVYGISNYFRWVILRLDACYGLIPFNLSLNDPIELGKIIWRRSITE